MQDKKQILIKNRYQLKEKIKEETTGTLYNGFDTISKKAVVIKHMRPQLLSLSLVEQIQEALYRLSIIKHNSFIIPFDSSAERKNFFIIQQAIPEEETIVDILAKLKSFTTESAVLVIEQAAEALSYLHRKKICHGNITPENIAILKDGSLKIKNTLVDAVIQHAHLQTGKFVADPAYVAPEQLKGSPTKPQSDLWALNALFYTLLTGETPFKISKDKTRMLQNISNKIILPTLRNPKIPKYLEDIIVHSLHFDPDLRSHSMLEFLSQLESKKVIVRLQNVKAKEQMAKNDQLNKNASQKENNPFVKSAFFSPILDRSKKAMQHETAKKIAALPKQTARGLKTMADRFDSIIEKQKEHPPLFQKPNTFLQKILIYGTIIFAVGLLGALLHSLFVGYFTSIPEIEIPSLTGLPIEKAKDILETKGLKGKIVSELVNASVPMDHVISQKPDAGRVVKKDRIIKLFVSKGIGETKVPELIGRAYDQAKTILARNNLGITITKHAYHPEVQKDFILQQSPEPEVIVQKQTTINVIVSAGFPATLKLKEKSPYNCVVEAMLFVPDNWKEQKIIVKLFDSKGTQTVFDKRVLPGQKERLQLISEDTALVEIYYNDELALKQSFLELQDNSTQEPAQ